MKQSKTKQHIVKTASKLFYSQGYNRTGINQIIKEAAIAKATLYSHFASKEEICVAYLQYKNKYFSREIQKFCRSKPKGKAQILALFEFLNAFFQKKEFNGCWCINTLAEIPKDNKLILCEIKSQKNAFYDFINALVLENFKEINKEKASTLGKQIYLLYESASAESYLHQSEWPITTMKKLSEQLIS